MDSSNPHLLLGTNTKSKSRSNISTNSSLPASIDPKSSPDTIFVQADPSNFKTIVQKLTGYNGKPISGEMSPQRQPFKLHERRLQTARKLDQIKLHDGFNYGVSGSIFGSGMERESFLRLVGETVMVSPVSPLEMIPVQGSPLTPRSPSEEEDRVINEKGFYLHPSPLNTPRGFEPPELLQLFPLTSPRDDGSPADH